MVKRNDTSTGRFYEIEGKKFPSVTTILGAVGKPQLIKWAASEERKLLSEAAADLYEDTYGTPKLNRPGYIASLLDRAGKVKAFQRVSQKAADIGTQVHHRVEYAIRKELGQEAGPEPPMTPAAWSSFASWENWRKGVDLKPKYCEQTVYSLTNEYAGTLDLIGEVNGRLALLDWKSSKGIYAEYSLQLAAYWKALSEMGHGTPEIGMIVRLPKTEGDSFEVKELHAGEVDGLFDVFLAVKKLWAWSYEHEKAYQAKWKK